MLTKKNIVGEHMLFGWFPEWTNCNWCAIRFYRKISFNSNSYHCWCERKKRQNIRIPFIALSVRLSVTGQNNQNISFYVFFFIFFYSVWLCCGFFFVLIVCVTRFLLLLLLLLAVVGSAKSVRRLMKRAVL